MKERRSLTYRTRVQLSSIAKALGKEAYAKGLPLSTNPYSADTSACKAWIRGWYEAENEAHQQES